MTTQGQELDAKLAEVLAQFGRLEAELADSYVTTQLCQEEGDAKGLMAAQTSLAHTLERIEPLRAEKSRLEEQQKAERAGRKRASRALRLRRFKAEVEPVLPDVVERCAALENRILAHARERLAISVEEEFLRTEVDSITVETNFARDMGLDPLRPRLPEWGQLRLGKLHVTQILMSSRDIQGSVRGMCSLAGDLEKESNKNGRNRVKS